MLRKETAFPRWRAMDRRWNKNTVSLLSSVTTVIHLPISWTSSIAIWFHVPAVSMATGKKRWVPARSQYLEDLLAAALSAAAPGRHAVSCRWDSAYVSGTVMSHAKGLPLAHGKKCDSIRSFTILSYQTDRFFDSWYLRPFYYYSRKRCAFKQDRPTSWLVSSRLVLLAAAAALLSSEAFLNASSNGFLESSWNNPISSQLRRNLDGVGVWSAASTHNISISSSTTIYCLLGAAVAVDSRHMTVSSSTLWSRFSPPPNRANGHVDSVVVVHGLLLAAITGRWLGKTPFVQVSTTWALTCPETVHQRPCMMREMETWLSDSRVGNNVTIVWLSTEANDQSSPLCNSVDLHNDSTCLQCFDAVGWASGL